MIAVGPEPVCIWPAGARLGEGPVWDLEERALYWVDIKAPAVHRITPSTGERRTWPMPEAIGAIARRKGAGFIATFKSGFALVDLDHGRIEHLGHPEPERPDNRFNDGKCDPAGRFWAGTMDDNEREPTGWLYRFDPDRTWRRLDGPYVCTNGPAFSPDGRTLYHTDTVGREIHAFDLAADGALTRKRRFVKFAEDDGYPDGMTVDAEGHLWVCHWGGWCVTRFTPDGKRERAIRLPVAQVTSCAFGGPDLGTLFITTAAIGLAPEALARQPLAGGLFAVQPGPGGLPPATYGG